MGLGNLSRVALLSLLFLSLTSAYSPNARAATKALQQQVQAQKQITQSTNRRLFIQASFAVGAAALVPSPAMAAEEIVLPTKQVVSTTFATIRYELEDPNGGVATMQSRIDAKDFVGLMDFTKTYDQELRKLRMGKAKKLLQSKELKEKGTEFANAVTFDLIGINRNSRAGQENAEGANKYLQELRDDIAKFLALESTIETEG